MDFAMHVCLEDFHDTVILPSGKTYPLVHFEFLVFDI